MYNYKSWYGKKYITVKRFVTQLEVEILGSIFSRRVAEATILVINFINTNYKYNYLGIYDIYCLCKYF